MDRLPKKTLVKLRPLVVAAKEYIDEYEEEMEMLDLDGWPEPLVTWAEHFGPEKTLLLMDAATREYGLERQNAALRRCVDRFRIALNTTGEHEPQTVSDFCSKFHDILSEYEQESQEAKPSDIGCDCGNCWICSGGSL